MKSHYISTLNSFSELFVYYSPPKSLSLSIEEYSSIFAGDLHMAYYNGRQPWAIFADPE